MTRLIALLTIVAAVVTPGIAGAQTQCGLVMLTIGIKGTGAVNGLQGTVGYPPSAAISCDDPTAPECMVRPIGPFASPMLFSVNDSETTRVTAAVARDLESSFPAPAPAVMTMTFVHFGPPPTLAQFELEESYVTDVRGDTLATATVYLASVQPIGQAPCPPEK